MAVLVSVLFLALTTADSATPEPAPCTESPTFDEPPPRDPAADPFGPGPWFVNSDKTMWASHAEPLVAGGQGNKVLWIRPRGVPLKIEGRRLDAESNRLRAVVAGNYPSGFQPTGLYFPSAGCWEVAAKAGGSSLTFRARVLSRARRY